MPACRSAAIPCCPRGTCIGVTSGAGMVDHIVWFVTPDLLLIHHESIWLWHASCVMHYAPCVMRHAAGAACTHVFVRARASFLFFYFCLFY